MTGTKVPFGYLSAGKYFEFQLNHGVSAFGPQAMTGAATNAGYFPALKYPNGTLVPVTPTDLRTSLRVPTQKSFLAHWNVLF